jgi:hypothetical protein
MLAGDSWVYLDQDTPFPDDTLITFEEGYVYELPTDGLP